MKVSIVVGKLWHAPQLARGLEELGHEPRILSTMVEGGGFGQAALHVAAMRLGQRVSGRLPLASPFLNQGFARWTRKARSDDDLTIAWSSFALPVIDAGHRVIVVRGSHHIRTQRELLADASKFSRPTLSQVALEEEEYRRSSYVTVPTDEIASDPAWSRGGAQAFAAAYGFPDAPKRTRRGGSGLRLVFVGEQGHRKGIDRLIGALGTRPPGVESFTLVGRRAPSSKRLAYPSWWTSVGVMPHDQVIQLMLDSDVLLLPSREEGMAIAGMEALACGMAVIATTESGLGQWVRRGTGVLLSEPDNYQRIREAIEAVVEARADMSEAALGVANSWSWRDHADAVLAPLLDRKI
jgi:starch synthase